MNNKIYKNRMKINLHPIFYTFWFILVVLPFIKLRKYEFFVSILNIGTPINETITISDNIIWDVTRKKLTGSLDRKYISSPIIKLNTAGQILAI